MLIIAAIIYKTLIYKKITQEENLRNEKLSGIKYNHKWNVLEFQIAGVSY